MLLHKMLFHEMQENHYEDKASNTQLLIIFAGRIVQQELLNISAD